MEVSETDSFSVSSESQLIEKRVLRTSIIWKLTHIRKKVLSEDKKVVSPIFQFSNRRWELTVYFDSYKGGNSVDLKCFDTVETSTCTIYLTSYTVTDDKGNILQETLDRSDVLCYSDVRLISSKTIAFIDYPKDGINSLTISLNISSEENTKPVLQERMNEEKEQSLGCTRKLSSDFEAFYENRQLSDVTLKLGDKEFAAHKLVLSARSKVFAAMFEHDMVENRQSTVDLVEMEAETVQDMLRYAYCAKVRVLSSIEAINLYVAADRYDLQELKDICRKVVVRGISLSNVFDVAAIADIRNDELLIRELKSFVSKNGKDLVKTEQWNAVCMNNPVLLTKMFEWSLSG